MTTLQELLDAADPDDRFSLCPIWEQGAVLEEEPVLLGRNIPVALPLDGLRKRAIWTHALETDCHVVFMGQKTKARNLWKTLIRDKKFGVALFLSTVGWLFEPREENPEPIPFIPWRSQAETAQEIHDAIVGGYDYWLTKDRDQGGTWLVVSVNNYLWNESNNHFFMMSSRVDALVDKPSPASLFWKFDNFQKWLPEWYQPAGYDPANKACKQEYYRRNPATGSLANGAAPTRNYGVGDRQRCIVFDEFPEWEEGQEAWDNCGATTNCRIAVGTPATTRNFAYQIRECEGDYSTTKIKKGRLKWKDDPRKNVLVRRGNKVVNIWLEQTLGDPANGIRGAISRATFRRQYDDNWDSGTGDAIYAEFAQFSRAYKGIPRDHRFPLGTCIDPGRGDDCAVIWIQWNFEIGRYQALHCYSRSAQTAEFFIPVILGRENPGEVLPLHDMYEEEAWDTIRRVEQWQTYDGKLKRMMPPYKGHYGDPFGANRNWSGEKSGFEKLSEAGIDYEYDKASEKHVDRQEALRQFLIILDIDMEHCKPLHDALLGYKKGPNGLPVHNETSHLVTALERFAVLCKWHEEYKPVAQQRVVNNTNILNLDLDAIIAETLRARTSGNKLTGPSYA